MEISMLLRSKKYILTYQDRDGTYRLVPKVTYLGIRNHIITKLKVRD